MAQSKQRFLLQDFSMPPSVHATLCACQDATLHRVLSLEQLFQHVFVYAPGRHLGPV